MWKIKEVKKSGKRGLKNNFRTLLLVGLFMTLVISEYILGKAGFDNRQIVAQIFNDKKLGIEIPFVEEKRDDIIFNKYFDEAFSKLFIGNMNGVIRDYNAKHNVTKGVAYTIFNVFTNGQTQIQNFTESVKNYATENHFESIILIVTSAFAVFLKVFLSNPISIGANRIYLESMNYKKTRITRILFPFKKKRYFSVVKSMFLMRFYKILWNFTIIGGFIKGYSYKMVPYIIAENPEIKPEDAIKISKIMMDGNKFQCFKLDLSFIGLDILQYVTFGLFGIYLTPYYAMTYVEVYTQLRHDYILNKKYGFELLNDEQLYNSRGYKSYPGSEERRKFIIEYENEYDVSSIILFFFIFAFVGWAWEVIYFILEKGVIVNRGTLYGPWLPIYGIGCTIIIVFTQLEKIRKILKNPFLTFCIIMMLCSTIEYITSWYIEKTTGLRYWDYTGIFMNLNGRICLECAIFFGLGGSLCVYIVAPLIERVLQKAKKNKKIIACIVLLVLFSTDMVFSQLNPRVGLGITDEIEGREILINEAINGKN